MDGRVCLITGADSGIGKEAAVEIAALGASLTIVSRDKASGESALAEIKQRSRSQDVALMIAEFASLASVRKLAEEFSATHDKLHVLVNNAGALNGGRRITSDGHEMTFGVNHLAPFLLTTLLLDLLKASAPSRIITTSSHSHTRATIHFDDLNAERKYGSMGMTAYGHSKLANLLFSYELARRLDGTGVTSNALHPGIVKTGFGRTSGGLYQPLIKVFHALGSPFPFLLSPAKGAETTVYLASSPEVETTTGKYFVKKQPVPSSDASHDTAVAKRLWSVSEELVA